MIETGRYQKIEVSKRVCYFCKTIVEDEIHFVINCGTYSHLRRQILNECLILKPNFEYYSDKEKFVFILNNEQLQTVLAKFCFLANELRAFLIKSPKSLS